MQCNDAHVLFKSFQCIHGLTNLPLSLSALLQRLQLPLIIKLLLLVSNF